MLRDTLRRAACLTAAGTVTALAVFASPAQAAGTATLSVQTDDIRIETGSGTFEDDFFWSADTTGSGVIGDVVMTVDASGLADLGSFKLTDSGRDACEAAGAVWTCAIGDVKYSDGTLTWDWDPDLSFTPFDGVTGTGSIKVAIAGDGATAASGERSFTVAEPVRFGIGEAPGGDVAIGDEVSFGVTVTNTGEHTIYNPVLHLRFIGLTPKGGYSNCGVSPYSVTCRFPVALKPGETYRLSAPFTYTVSADVFAPGGIDTWVHWSTEDYGLPTTGTGPELSVVGAASAPADAPGQLVFDGEGSFWEGNLFQVTGVNKANFVARGATLPAKTGRTTVTLTVANNGPATVWDGRSGGPLTALWFTLPKGVEPVSLPEGCTRWAEGNGGDRRGDVVCGVDIELKAGGKAEFAVEVNVKKVDLAEKGEVAVGYGWHGESQAAKETSTSDNTAVIAFEGAESGTGGGLAKTGVNTALIAGAGAVLAVGGFFALRRFRRRGNPAFYGSVED
ncbi:hypothetical protein Afil01_51310 [Actinorhabdospora filicis]|uniref:LPXTG-motif cell wall-anchored protein n=1 Tax=Actinorhabdospora filicis TaxID=1785913 RepID=A0A9W6SNV8_9ACTN|nr:hypothetical protein [Actinorhabdospora filicis]GLZ80324.1 hypothetical protein Afil01_51310 [Actinorhabdospora filicis]